MTYTALRVLNAECHMSHPLLDYDYDIYRMLCKSKAMRMQHDMYTYTHDYRPRLSFEFGFGVERSAIAGRFCLRFWCVMRWHSIRQST